MPSQEDHLVHLATWMPCERAGQLLHALTGGQVSDATVRRHSDQAGPVSEEVHNAHSPASEQPTCHAPAHLVLSADGAMVPLGGGVWAEGRPLAMGDVEPDGHHTRTTTLSSVSRMTDAITCPELAEGDMERRPVRHAEPVAAVMDGAEWLQGVVDGHRPDAVRMLDVPHAAHRISAILETVQHAGCPLPHDALARSLHLLTHGGPGPVLRWRRHLTRSLRGVGTIREDLASVHTREAFMPSPRSQDSGWPRGSGMVERATTLVMHTRRNGPGMQWARSHVHPMRALRNAVWNDRWSEAWTHTASACLDRLRQERVSHAQDRHQQATHRFMLAWVRFLLPHAPARPSQPPPSPASPTILAGRPPASHPWRRPCLPRSPPVVSATQ